MANSPSRRRTNRLQRLAPSNNTHNIADRTDSGFGASLHNTARLVAADGSFNVERIGMQWTPLNFYQYLVTTNWAYFSAIVVVFYLLFNVFFGLLYMVAGEGQLSGIDAQASWWHRFGQYFFFSVQTFATIGYGAMSPQGTIAHLIVTAEALMDIMMTALATGLLFARFSRPSVKIGFSSCAVVAPYQHGINGFMCRICNMRTNKLIENEAQLMMSVLTPTPDGTGVKRSFFNLPLQINKIQYFSLSWTLNHPITPDSPLYGWSAADLEAGDAEFLIMLKCFDDTFLQTVYINSSYKWQEVLWGAKFTPMISYGKAQNVVLNYNLLSTTEKATLFEAENKHS